MTPQDLACARAELAKAAALLRSLREVLTEGTVERHRLSLAEGLVLTVRKRLGPEGER